MKLYLAARFELKDAMCEVRDFLVSDGHEVTAQWIDVEAESDGDASEEERASNAVMDVKDVLRADALVVFSDPRKSKYGGGGRHVEFGIALQAGKGIIVVGPKGEHIFHYWPGVEHVADVDALVERLRRMEPRPLAMDEGAGDAMHGKKNAEIDRLRAALTEIAQYTDMRSGNGDSGVNALANAALRGPA